MSAPTPHQLLLALSKVRLNPAQVRVLSYLAAFTVPAPRSEIFPHWVVGAGARTIAHETGLTYRAVLHALWGDKRADRCGQRGLVELGVVHCWSRGGGAGEAVWSVNGNFEEWAVEWAPTTRTNRPATLREVLFELKSAFAAPWGTAKPDFFAAPQGAALANGRKAKPHTWWAFLRRKGKVGFAAPWGAAVGDDGAAPQGRAPLDPIGAGPPFFLETSSPVVRGQQQQGELRTEENTPAAAELLAELRKLTKRNLFGGPVDQVVQAVCDNNVTDVGWIITELRRHRDSFGPSRWRQAVDLALMMLAADPPQVLVERPDCAECHGSTWVYDDDLARPCSSCRPQAG
jgi:hypothetical protein